MRITTKDIGNKFASIIRDKEFIASHFKKAIVSNPKSDFLKDILDANVIWSYSVEFEGTSVVEGRCHHCGKIIPYDEMAKLVKKPTPYAYRGRYGYRYIPTFTECPYCHKYSLSRTVPTNNYYSRENLSLFSFYDVIYADEDYAIISMFNINSVPLDSCFVQNKYDEEEWARMNHKVEIIPEPNFQYVWIKDKGLKRITQGLEVGTNFSITKLNMTLPSVSDMIMLDSEELHVLADNISVKLSDFETFSHDINEGIKAYNKDAESHKVKKKSKSELEAEDMITKLAKIKLTPIADLEDCISSNCLYNVGVISERVGATSTLLYVDSTGKVKSEEVNSMNIKSSGYQDETKNIRFELRKGLSSNLYEMTTHGYIITEESSYLVLRNLTIKGELDKTLRTYDVEVTENSPVVFFTEKGVYYANNKDNIEGTTNKADRKTHIYSMRSGPCISDPDKLKEMVSRSCFAKLGLIEAWGLNPAIDSKIEEIGVCNYNLSNTYMYSVINKPFLELTVKCGLKNLTSNLITASDKDIKQQINPKATNLSALLGLNKAELKVFRENNYSLSNLLEFRRIKEIDPSFDISLLSEVSNSLVYGYNGIDHFCNIASKLKIPMKKAVEYLQLVYDYQCIEKREALTIWSDYVNMAVDLNYEIADKNIKFPQSLKKEHDVAVFSSRALANKYQIEQFKKTSKENLFLEYSFEKYCIKVPLTPEEIIHEGKCLKHCVASYVSKIANAETIVCFIRKKDAVDTPFYTVEVSKGGDVVVQCKGFCNCSPTPEIFDFLNKWAKFKKLRIDFTN